MIHAYFIQAVAENRNMSVANVTPLADGRFFLGSEAKANGLVDELGGEQEALDWINATIKEEPVIVVYEHKQNLLDVLAGLSAQNPHATSPRCKQRTSRVPCRWRGKPQKPFFILLRVVITRFLDVGESFFCVLEFLAVDEEVVPEEAVQLRHLD